MKTPHKHAELIKAWADGAEIEYRCNVYDQWKEAPNPNWYAAYEYRIKPKEDAVRYAKALWNESGLSIKWFFPHEFERGYDNLKLTFDGETGKLKAAEVIQ